MNDISTERLKMLTVGVIPLYSKDPVVELTPTATVETLKFTPHQLEPLAVEAMMEFCDKDPGGRWSASSVFIERTLANSLTAQIFGANMDQALLLRLRAMNKAAGKAGLSLRTLITALAGSPVTLPDWLKKTKVNITNILYVCEVGINFLGSKPYRIIWKPFVVEVQSIVLPWLRLLLALMEFSALEMITTPWCLLLLGTLAMVQRELPRKSRKLNAIKQTSLISTYTNPRRN